MGGGIRGTNVVRPTLGTSERTASTCRRYRNEYGRCTSRTPVGPRITPDRPDGDLAQKNRAGSYGRTLDGQDGVIVLDDREPPCLELRDEGSAAAPDTLLRRESVSTAVLAAPDQARDLARRDPELRGSVRARHLVAAADHLRPRDLDALRAVVIGSGTDRVSSGGLGTSPRRHLGEPDPDVFTLHELRVAQT